MLFVFSRCLCICLCLFLLFRCSFSLALCRSLLFTLIGIAALLWRHICPATLQRVCISFKFWRKAMHINEFFWFSMKIIKKQWIPSISKENKWKSNEFLYLFIKSLRNESNLLNGVQLPMSPPPPPPPRTFWGLVET